MNIEKYNQLVKNWKEKSQDQIQDNYVIYKKEKVEVLSDDNYPYGFSFNRYRNIIVIWDKDYDTRLLACSNSLSSSIHFNVYCIFQNKGEIRILFKDNIPSKYTVDQYISVQKDSWKITEVYSYKDSEYFLFPNCPTIDINRSEVDKKNLLYKNSLVDYKTITKGFDIINDIKKEVKEPKINDINDILTNQVKSDKQYSYIVFLRDKYKTKENTKEDFKWIWDYDVNSYLIIVNNNPYQSNQIYYKNISYKIYLDRTKDTVYKFGYSVYKGTIIEWDEDYDRRIFIFVDNILKQRIKNLIRCKEHEAGLILYFKDSIPLKYNEGDSIDIDDEEGHDVWSITECFIQ